MGVLRARLKVLVSSLDPMLISNSFLSLPTEYDLRMVHYLKELKSSEILENTIVIFLSDHGMRFGDIRKYFTGWLEERLPFLFISLPEKFKRKYPEFERNLRINQDRLVSPYDLHLTLRQILFLSGYKSNIEAEGCPTCQSLFEEVPKDRKCFEAGIDDIWCACNRFKEINKNSKKIEQIANFAVEKLNFDLSSYENCAKLELSQILSANEFEDSNSNFDYLITFEVLPSHGQMEATIRCKDDNCSTDREVLGEISRINLYGNQSYCIEDAIMKKYCFCV